LEVAGVFGALFGFGDEVGFELVLGFAGVGLVENAEGTGPSLAGEFEGGDFVGDVVAGGVFGGAVVFLLVDYGPCAGF
jgi:hypothetical protein